MRFEDIDDHKPKTGRLGDTTPPDESPKVPSLAATEDLRASISNGQIGCYKLLQPIGEGGIGVVYMAEQVASVRRKVALKIIKPGMDSRQVIALFEAERQALAMMDHQSIARRGSYIVTSIHWASCFMSFSPVAHR